LVRLASRRSTGGVFPAAVPRSPEGIHCADRASPTCGAPPAASS